MASKKIKSGPCFDIGKHISNDVFDIFYVSHLLHADGLITNDKDLMKPLALAAFPHKDVFSSIDDVPCRYCTSKKEADYTHRPALPAGQLTSQKSI